MKTKKEPLEMRTRMVFARRQETIVLHAGIIAQTGKARVLKKSKAVLKQDTEGLDTVGCRVHHRRLFPPLAEPLQSTDTIFRGREDTHPNAESTWTRRRLLFGIASSLTRFFTSTFFSSFSFPSSLGDLGERPSSSFSSELRSDSTEDSRLRSSSGSEKRVAMPFGDSRLRGEESSLLRLRSLLGDRLRRLRS